MKAERIRPFEAVEDQVESEGEVERDAALGRHHVGHRQQVRKASGVQPGGQGFRHPAASSVLNGKLVASTKHGASSRTPPAEPSFGDRPAMLIGVWLLLGMLSLIGTWLGSVGP